MTLVRIRAHNSLRFLVVLKLKRKQSRSLTGNIAWPENQKLLRPKVGSSGHSSIRWRRLDRGTIDHRPSTIGTGRERSNPTTCDLLPKNFHGFPGARSGAWIVLLRVEQLSSGPPAGCRPDARGSSPSGCIWRHDTRGHGCQGDDFISAAPRATWSRNSSSAAIQLRSR